MESLEVLFAVGGWIVATLVIVIRIRHDKLAGQERDRLRGFAVRLIEATERQKEPLGRLVALSPPGSEMRDEAVTALGIANTAVQAVVRAEPKLKPEGFTLSTE